MTVKEFLDYIKANNVKDNAKIYIDTDDNVFCEVVENHLSVDKEGDLNIEIW